MSSELLQSELERLRRKAAAYGDDTFWEQNEFSEILPAPTPVSLSLLRSLASQRGATGRVCAELGIGYDPAVPIEDYIETIYGRTFINRAAERQLTFDGGQSRGALRRLRSSARVQAAVKTFYRDFTQTKDLLNGHYQDLARIEIDTFTVEQLRQHINTLVEIMNRHYRFVVKAGICAGYALSQLERRHQGSDLAGLISINPSKLAGKDRLASIIFDYRHNRLDEFACFSAATEYELACPRYLETPPRGSGSSNARTMGDEIPVPGHLQSWLLPFKVYESLKVIYKTLLLRELHLLRAALLACDQILQLKEGVFYLTLGELLQSTLDVNRPEIEARQAREQAFTAIDVPARVDMRSISALLEETLTPPPFPLQGRPVTSRGFSGAAFLYRNRSDIDRIRTGQVVVARQASPELVRCFDRASGIICETGGLLSHLSIVAREQGFPLVIQAKGALAAIRDEDTLQVTASGEIFRVYEPTEGVSPPMPGSLPADRTL